MTKIKNSTCDKTQKLEMWQNSETLNGEKNQDVTTKKLKMWHNSKTKNLKKLKNTQCDKTQTQNVTTQQLKQWPNLKTQNVYLFLFHSTKIYVTQKQLQLKTQIVTKLKTSNWWNTKIVQNSISDKTLKKKSQFTIWLDTSTLDDMFSGQRFAILQCLLFTILWGKLHNTLL